MLTKLKFCLYRDKDRNEEMFSKVFRLALDTACRMRIGEEGETSYSPHETEIQRRCWWTLRKLSYRSSCDPHGGVGEMAAFPEIPLPLNVNDVDLVHVTSEAPQARQGATEMSFFLCDLELARLAVGLEVLNRTQLSADADTPILLHRKNLVEYRVGKIEKDFLHYADASRPLDWFLMLTAKAMLVARPSWIGVHKARLLTNDDAESNRKVDAG
jgi:hypothetical protein